MPRLLLPLIASCFVLLAACGDEGKSLPDAAAAADANLLVDVAPPRETIMATRTLQPGQFAEGAMTGGPSDLALIHLEAPINEMDWNIHGHAGTGTQNVFEELNKMTVDYSFVPSAQAEWYLLVRNSGPQNMDVKITVKLYGAMQWAWL
ncbi:MAG: hypothetical protein H0T46_02630 [Deltaproteobacteria bacterium]|nr:hypothetical protein [Deltaproteobacteria bacterium]